MFAYVTELLHTNLHVDMTILKDNRQKRSAKYPQRRKDFLMDRFLVRTDKPLAELWQGRNITAGRTHYIICTDQCKGKMHLLKCLRK